MFKRPFRNALKGPLTAAFSASLALLCVSPAAAAPQTCPNDDIYAGNNDCLTATPLSGSTGWINDVALLDSARFDVFDLTLQPGETLIVDAFFSHADGNIDIGLRELLNGVCSNPYLANAQSTTDNETVSYTNTSSSPMLMKIQFFLADSVACTEYSFRYVVTSCPGDDFLQGNTSCIAGAELGGLNSPLETLTAMDGGSDYFRVSVPAGETLNVRIDFQHAIADLDLFVSSWSPYPCDISLASSEGVTNEESIVVVNPGPDTLLIGIQVLFYGSSGGSVCAPYDLSWEITPPACTLTDPLGPTSCSSAIPVPDSFILEDAVAEFDQPDYFRLYPSTGDRWRLKIDFLHAEGDLDMAIYDLNDCSGNWLSVSQGTTDSEFLEIDADSDYIVQVYRYSGAGVCSRYDIEFLLSQTGNSLGWLYCEGLPNAVSLGADLRAFGSESIGDNDFRLEASSLPPSSFGFYLNSTGVGFVTPPGSVGRLCINGGGVGRFIRPGEIQQSGPSGITSLALDLASIPRPSGTVAILPGERWSFQYWYRDTASTGPVSNFSDALLVFFE